MAMIARLRPVAELLEVRTLRAGSLVSPEPLIPLATPLMTSLVVSRSGTTEMLTLVEKNTGVQDVNVTEGCGVVDFWVTQGGVEVWRNSKDGPQPLCPISTGGLLRSQESRTFMATWDGHFNLSTPPDPTGPFVLHGIVDGVEADAPNPSPTPSPSPSPSQPGLSMTLTTDQTAYQSGQPVVMTLTRTNTG